MATQEATPDRETDDAKKEAIGSRSHYSGGDALLDAITAIQADDPVENEPTATNRPQTKKTDEPNGPTSTGEYPADLSQLDDEGTFSISKDNPNEE